MIPLEHLQYRKSDGSLMTLIPLPIKKIYDEAMRQCHLLNARLPEFTNEEDYIAFQVYILYCRLSLVKKFIFQR